MSDESKYLAIIESEIVLTPDENIAFNETGLTVSGKLSYDQWEKAVERLADFDSRADMFFVWAWGDLLSQGQARFGEKYSQAINKTGKAYQTLANYKWVAEHTQKHLRAIPGLSLAHYLKVGKIKDETVKTYLLLQASEQGWSAKTDLPREMEKLVKKLPAPEDGEDSDEGGNLEPDELNDSWNNPPPATKDDQLFDLTIENHNLTNEKQTAVLQYSLITEKVNEAIGLIAPLLDEVSLEVKNTLTQVVEVLCSIPNGEAINLVNQVIDQYKKGQMTGLIDTLDKLVGALKDAE